MAHRIIGYIYIYESKQQLCSKVQNLQLLEHNIHKMGIIEIIITQNIKRERERGTYITDE